MFIRNVIKEVHVHMRKENKEQKIIWLSKILGIKKKSNSYNKRDNGIINGYLVDTSIEQISELDYPEEEGKDKSR